MRKVAWVLGLMLLSRLASGVEIIANQSVSANSLSLASARAIFGLRQTQWMDDTSIQVFVLADKNATHVALCKEKLNLFPYQLRQSWDRLVYAGMAQAPIEVSNEEELVNRVAATQGAIGYVRKVKPNDSIKILQIK